MTLRSKCLLYLVVTATLWSLSGVLVKSINWNSLAISSARSLISMLTLLFLMRKDLHLASFFKNVGRKEWLAGFFLAMISITFVSATKLTTAANAILLQYTAPVWVALLAPLILRERTSNRDWCFMMAAFGGMTLFFADSLSLSGFWGNILGIFSGVFFAALAMITRYIKDAQPVKAMILGNFLAFIFGFYFWFQPGWLLLSFPAPPSLAFLTAQLPAVPVAVFPSFADIVLILIAGTFQFGLSYYLYTLAARGVTSLEMVLIPIIEPILSPIWVFWAIGEQPGLWSLIGGSIVLGTISLWGVLKARQR